MIESLLDPKPLPTSESPGAAALEELFELATVRNLDVMLRKALGIVTRILGAEAGSILFQAQSPRRVQSGAFRREALARIKRWEEAISRRLLDTTWNIPNATSVPVSVLKITDNQLVLANIPLLRKTTVVGSLSLVLPPGRELTANQRNLLVHIAKSVGQMATLVADMELAQQRLNQMGVFYQVGQALVTTFDIKQLLSDTMQLAASVIDAGAASIMLTDEDTDELVYEVSHGARAKMMRQQRIPMGEGIAGWVARNGHPVIANDARTDPRFSHRVDVRTGFLTQSIAAVPLKIKGRIIGVLEVLNKYSGTGFGQEDIRLMNSIAAQAAIAIENARLYQQVCQERDNIIKAQENMQRELARNLHDGPVQILAAISMRLDYLERLNERLSEAKPEVLHSEISTLRNLVHKATRDARNILFELRPIILGTKGVVAALDQYANQLNNSEDFVVHFKSVDKISYDAQIEAMIFSIIQEAINNVRRHAGARNVWLSLEVKNSRLVVTVRDDGSGFDVGSQEENYDRAGSFGLLNMKERAKSIEAELQIESRTEVPSRGTAIQLIVPLPPLDGSEKNFELMDSTRMA